MHVLILGLPGSGKGVLAEKLSERFGYEVIGMDRHRYGENWRKKSMEEFRISLMNEINKDDKPKIIEGVYNDEVRIKVVQDLLPFIRKILIIRPESLEVTIAQLIDRSINRFIGKENAGTCIESSKDRACLVIDNVQNYEENVDVLLGDFSDNPKVIFDNIDALAFCNF